MAAAYMCFVLLLCFVKGREVDQNLPCPSFSFHAMLCYAMLQGPY